MIIFINRINNDIECDILIIGGGITGVSTAYFLKDSNKKIVLVERNKLCMGTTAKSTVKLTFLQDDMINKIKNIYRIICLIEKTKFITPPIL